jgi:OTU domain-containing protein 5
MMNSGNDSHLNAPIRLCYHRGVHYNSIIDPHKATIGVGLGKTSARLNQGSLLAKM